MITQRSSSLLPPTVNTHRTREPNVTLLGEQSNGGSFSVDGSLELVVELPEDLASGLTWQHQNGDPSSQLRLISSEQNAAPGGGPATRTMRFAIAEGAKGLVVLYLREVQKDGSVDLKRGKAWLANLYLVPAAEPAAADSFSPARRDWMSLRT